MRSSKGEKGWLIGFGLAVMILTTIPYLIGFTCQNEEWVYTGFLFGVEDGNSYIAKMLIGQNGFWLFRTPYTTHAQAGFLAFIPYLLLGKLASPPDVHTQLVVLFHIFRWIACFCYVFAVYDFISLFIQSIPLRWLGVALAVFGGGMGWLSLFGLAGWWKDGLPLEFYSPETFGFLSVLGLPHLAMARAFLLWGLTSYLEPVQTQNKIVSVWMNYGWWLGLGFFQPLTVVVGGAVILSHLGWQVVRTWLVCKQSSAKETGDRLILFLRRAIWAGGFALPLTVYNFASFQLDPFLSVWQKQNRILSPPVMDYLLGYAIVLVFAVMGMVWIRRERQGEKFSLVLAWIILFPLLAYAPYNLQRRLPEGVWVAWIILALAGMSQISGRWKLPAKVFLSLSFLSTLVLYTGGLNAVTVPGLPLFRETGEVQVFNYLAENAPVNSIVLALHQTSNALPAWAPMRTLVGHGPESFDIAELLPWVEAFYSSAMPTQEKVRFLAEYDIQYVICGPEEYRLGSCQFDETLPLALRMEIDDYQLYEVLDEKVD